MSGDDVSSTADAVHDRETIRASWEDDESILVDDTWRNYFRWAPGYGWIPLPVPPPRYKIDLTVADPRKT